MKNKRLVAESLMILCYIFVLYHLSALCRYGGVKRHLLWMLLGLLVFCATLIYLLITDTPKIKNKTAFLVKLMSLIGATVLFTSNIIYSAIPYNGKLAWKIQDLIHTREVTLTHNNVFDTGIEGILDDYASPGTREKGIRLIREEMEHIPNPKIKEIALKHLQEIENGKRDFRF